MCCEVAVAMAQVRVSVSLLFLILARGAGALLSYSFLGGGVVTGKKSAQNAARRAPARPKTP